MTASAFIAGCSGYVLTKQERRFFRDADPWGLIVFRRNVADKSQLAALVSAFREAVGRADAPVLVDQEGGRVQRLAPPHWPKYPPGRRYGELFRRDRVTGRELTRLSAMLIAHDLAEVGITVDCIPVLDVPLPDAHDVIGDRAYCSDPDTVAILGRAAAEGLLAGGVLPVIKHVPGHGRALADSHEALPVVESSREELERSDFRPFTLLADMPLAMTAHVVYTAVDPGSPITTSAEGIGGVIRGHIGYDGCLMSDDLSMRALSGSLRSRAEAAFSAGCDLALHCNGDMAEMMAVAEGSGRLEGDAARRTAAALARIAHAPEPFDPEDVRRHIEAALAACL
jgi:beta-N-acetylhexosaminidase